METTLKNAKQTYDKFRKELSTVCLVKQKLARKGWGDGPTNLLASETDKLDNKVEGLFQKWASDKAKEFNTMATMEIESDAEALDAERKSVEASYNEYKKNVLADFDKLR